MKITALAIFTGLFLCSCLPRAKTATANLHSVTEQKQINVTSERKIRVFTDKSSQLYQLIGELGRGSNGVVYYALPITDHPVPLGEKVSTKELELLKMPKKGHEADLEEEALYLKRVHQLDQKLYTGVKASPFTKGHLKVKNSDKNIQVLLKPYYDHVSLDQFLKNSSPEIRDLAIARIKQFTYSTIFDTLNFEPRAGGKYQFKPFLITDFIPSNFIVLPGKDASSFTIMTFDGKAERLSGGDDFFGGFQFPSEDLSSNEVRKVLDKLHKNPRNLQTLIENYRASNLFFMKDQWDHLIMELKGLENPLPYDDDLINKMLNRALTESCRS